MHPRKREQKCEDVSLLNKQQLNHRREDQSTWLPLVKGARWKKDAKKFQKRKKVKSHCLSARERKQCSLFDPSNQNIKLVQSLGNLHGEYRYNLSVTYMENIGTISR